MAYFVVDNITDKAFTLTLADLEHPFTTDYYVCFYLKVDGEIVVNTPAFDFSTDATTVTFSYGFSDSGTLVSGESYDISVTVVTKDGNYWNIPTQSGDDYVTVKLPQEGISIPSTPTTPSYKMVDSYNSLNLTISWNYSSSIKRIWVLLFKGEKQIGEDSFIYTASGETTEFSELSFCSDYEIEIYTSYYTEGDKSWSSPKVVRIYTPPSKRIYEEGTVSISRVNYNNQICAAIDAGLILSYGFNFQKITVRAYQCSSDSGGDIIYPGDGYKTIYYSKLADGTYSFEIVADYKGSVTVDEYGNEVTYTKSIKIEAPSAFNWTETELYALQNRGAVATITYSRWNDLMTYISRMLRYKGMYDVQIGSNDYEIAETTKIINAPIEYAKIGTRDRTLTAKKFNIANYCINKIADNTEITDRVGLTEAGDDADDVLGEYFITFVDRLNNI